MGLFLDFFGLQHGSFLFPNFTGVKTLAGPIGPIGTFHFCRFGTNPSGEKRPLPSRDLSTASSLGLDADGGHRFHPTLGFDLPFPWPTPDEGCYSLFAL